MPKSRTSNLDERNKVMYWEVELKVKMKPESTKAFINRVTLGFDHAPSLHEVKTELVRRYPEVNLVSVENSYDATRKAKELINYYNKTA